MLKECNLFSQEKILAEQPGQLALLFLRMITVFLKAAFFWVVSLYFQAVKWGEKVCSITLSTPACGAPQAAEVTGPLD